MGGIFRAPKPTVIDSPAPQAQAETVAQTAAQTSAAVDDAGRAARIAAVERARRGIAGTVATSARGVLDPLPLTPQRKTLLGE
jgi:hypothetical protein